MSYYLVKIVLTSLIVVAVSELARRSSLLAALLASLPLVSLLGMIWLYLDTRDTRQVAALAGNIFWLVLPSLALFVVLPLALRQGLGFWTSLALGVLATVATYGLTLGLLSRLGVAA